jgi:pyroglutamyl-peptidase
VSPRQRHHHAADGRPVIIAAFEPFHRRKRNRARDAALMLKGEEIGGAPVEIADLPVSYAALPVVVKSLLAREPALLLLVGESTNARKLLVERFGVNVAHSRIRDNAGAHPVDEPLVRGGEPARQVAFDPRRAANAAIAAGCPSDVSSHAGTFCCNAALYHALGMAADQPGKPKVAFVHVPARLPWARDARAARGLLAIAQHLVTTLS